MIDDPTRNTSDLHRFLFEHAPDPTLVVDDEGHVVLANRAAQELAGVDLASFFAWSHDRAPELVTFQAQLRVRGQAATEVALEDAAQRRRVLALEGRRYGVQYVVVLRDVTAAREAEEEMERLRLAEGAGQLAAAVLHDFNNLLTVIGCSAALIARGGRPESAPALAGDVIAAAERASRLVRQISSFARAESASPRPVDLREAILELRPLLDRVLGDGIDLVLDLGDDLREALVDADQLSHVLINLAANARDAMPRGGRVTVHAANVSRDGVVLTFSDDGVGMPPEVQARAFDARFTTKGERGMGLGLANAYDFARRSGGSITMRSAPGEGTTLALYLPSASSVVLAAARRSRTSPARGAGETILVVDDEDRVRAAVCELLRAEGYRVLDAARGEEAVALAKGDARGVDLALLDVMLPGVRGRALVDQLGASRVLFMTGHAEEGAGADLGAGAVLRKAFSPVELARRVREALDTP